MKIDFDGAPAYVFHCPICGGRHVGTSPDDDPETANWMKMHANHHKQGFKDEPPNTFMGMSIIQEPKK
jgi:hypothetical protein